MTPIARTATRSRPAAVPSLAAPPWAMPRPCRRIGDAPQVEPGLRDWLMALGLLSAALALAGVLAGAIVLS
jgi:hypothetical protein